VTLKAEINANNKDALTPLSLCW